MAHKFNVTEWEAKKQAKEELDQPHTPSNSVSALRDRVSKLERLANIKPNP